MCGTLCCCLSRLLRHLLFRLYTLEIMRLSSNQDDIRLNRVVDSSCGSLCLGKNKTKHGGSRSRAVILLMSCIIFSDWWSGKCCNTCLPSIASRSFLSFSFQVYVQMYICENFTYTADTQPYYHFLLHQNAAKLS